jgi:hypothetical protein
MNKSKNKSIRHMKTHGNITLQKVNKHTAKNAIGSEGMKPKFLSSKE